MANIQKRSNGTWRAPYRGPRSARLGIAKVPRDAVSPDSRILMDGLGKR
jgi:hypothetical protein